MRLALALVCVPLVAFGCGSGSSGSTTNSSSDPTGDDSADGGSGTVMDDGGISFPPTGNQYVDARRCPACHQGPDPQSTGVMSGALSPIPGDFGPGVTLYGPNLTPDTTTGIGSWTDDQISTAILSGIDNQGERLCPQMSHFPDMQPTELQSIIAFLRALPAVSHQTTPSVCPPLKY
jgi:hypothetical protein